MLAAKRPFAGASETLDLQEEVFAWGQDLLVFKNTRVQWDGRADFSVVTLIFPHSFLIPCLPDAFGSSFHVFHILCCPGEQF